MIFDFHSHPSFKAFNSKGFDSPHLIPDPDLKRERFRRDSERVALLDLLDGELNFTSQTHLDALKKGQVKVSCLSLYPLEKGFTEVGTKISDSMIAKLAWDYLTGKKLIQPFKKKLAALGKNEMNRMIGYLTGFDKERIEDVNAGFKSYYEWLVAEKDFVESVSGDNGFLVAKDYNAIVDSSADLAFFYSIEGAHVFSSSKSDHLKDDAIQNEAFKKFGKDIIKNIYLTKEWSIPPFMITFSHHFYNHLAGHAPSMGGFIGFLINQTGAIDNEDTGIAENYFDLGFRKLGLEAIDALLSRQNVEGKQVRRILIDTKHMSAAARLEYISHVQKQSETGDHIPIIASHAAANGRPSLKHGIGSNRDGTKQEQKGKVFRISSVNLFDDEIQAIVRSGGLIGIMLDEKRMIGESLPSECVRYTKRIKIKPHDRNKNQMTERMYRQRFAGPYGKFIYAKKQYKRANAGLYRCTWKLKNERIESKRYERLKNRYTLAKKPWEKVLRKIFAGIFLNQVLYMVETGDKEIGDGRTWECLCLGTDYEGVVNPMDVYGNAAELGHLEEDLIAFWNDQIEIGHRNNNPDNKYIKLLYNGFDLNENKKRVSELVKKVLWGNGMNFLKRYYNDDYLLKGQV